MKLLVTVLHSQDYIEKLCLQIIGIDFHPQRPPIYFFSGHTNTNKYK